jgi:tRNA nucleotidyltransferase (CCA-adding enzyme)
MALTVKQSFATYKSNLEITDRQVSLVGTRRTNVVNALAANLTLHSTQPSLLMGSWDRQTLTRFLSEGDVDVMVVLHYGENKAWDTPEGTVRALDRFKTILQAQNAYKSTPMRRDRNCITMQFSEFRLDVVPAFQYEGGYYQIPDSVRRMWVSTDPHAFAD